MGCASCSVTKNGVPQGCGNKGSCSSGSCNKRNTYDWLTTLDISDPLAYNIVEVSFKKGNRKDFYINPTHTQAITGDLVVVESTSGYNVGRISLSGDLVRLQMKKKRKLEENVLLKIVRKANYRDIEKLQEARGMEKEALVKARKMARTLDLGMKIGDVEYQGDKRKATFYYTAEGRVDFRELVRMFAKEFRVKIEMKQIGSRQESGLIGGIGTCGRELCCATWKANFETVTTTAARYQNLAINQTKLTGQCGRLKCCLNYELDTYIDALGDFPQKADVIKIEGGVANLIKTDIFKGIMYYSIKKDNLRGPLVALRKENVKKFLALNKKGVHIANIYKVEYMPEVKEVDEDEIEHEFADVTGEIELPEIKKRKSKSKRRNQQNRRKPSNRKPDSNQQSGGNKQQGTQAKTEGNKDKQSTNKNRNNRRNKPNRNKKSGGNPNNNSKSNSNPKGSNNSRGDNTNNNRSNDKPNNNKQ